MKNKVFKLSQLLTVLCVVSCVLLSAVLVSNVWGKHFSGDGSDDGARVAGFVFDVQDQSGSFALDISSVNRPGTEKSFTFTVTNENEAGKVSEVAQAVSAQITVSGGLPLSVTLKRVNAEGDAEVLTLDYDPESGSASSASAADIAAFLAGTAKNERFTLTVLWPESENDSAYSGRTATVTLSFTAAQID